MRLAEAVVRTGPHVLLADKVFYLDEFSKVSGLLYPTEYSEIFLQEQEPNTIATLLQSRSNWAFLNGLANPLGLELLEL